MNKVIAAVGLAALSAASVQAQDLAAPPTKDWSVAATVRGFYDDNYLTQPATIVGPSGPIHPRLQSWGTEAIPSFGWNHAAEGTSEFATYVYDVRWYENKSDLDQSHQLNLGLTREFSPQYKLSVSDSFVVAQEPTVIDPSVISSPLRVEGNNIRNAGVVNFNDKITKELSLDLGSTTTLYDYPQTAKSVIGFPFTGAQSLYPTEPSRSALLNRIEELVTLDLRWNFTETTSILFGYQFGDTSYTSSEYINYPYGGASPYLAPANAGAAVFKGDHSDVRDSYSHFIFIGGDDKFSDALNGGLRVGAEYVDYYKNVDGLGNNAPTSRVSPYVDASLTDVYQQGCTAQIGVKHIHNSTDVVGTGGDLASGGTVPVLDEESTAIYLSDSHQLTDKLTASVMGQAQLSTFVGGGPSYNDKMDQFFVLQVNFSYKFTPMLSAETGYNFNRLKSDLPDRAYTRDFMYLGLRATY